VIYSDAVWTDYDKDGDDDLVMVGEWMPITVFLNTEGAFTDTTAALGLTNYRMVEHHRKRRYGW
jgi:hypothetical protein